MQPPSPSPRPTRRTVAEPPPLGGRLQQQRLGAGLSLDELSRRAGVSKSMLSQIERNQTNPTVAVVWRLATALEIAVAELLGERRSAEPAIALLPEHQLPSLRSPDGRCHLRILGPIELAGQFEWYELSVQPGGELDSQSHAQGAREHLSVLSGSLEVTVDGQVTVLRSGETARYVADQNHCIRNRGRGVAQAVLVVAYR